MAPQITRAFSFPDGARRDLNSSHNVAKGRVTNSKWLGPLDQCILTNPKPLGARQTGNDDMYTELLFRRRLTGYKCRRHPS